MTGDNVSIAKLDTSTRKRGKKKSKVYSTAGVGGLVRHITIRSKGNSKINGAAMVPTMALPKATQNPLFLARYAITKKVTNPESIVTGVMGSFCPVKGPICRYNSSTYAVSATRNMVTDNNQITTIEKPRNFPGLLTQMGWRNRKAKYNKTAVMINRTTARIMEPLPV
jgi:hypothetical protein